MIQDSYDCVVIGGGPAGSTAAALVAEAGHATLLVEREKVPRFHVGESLMPECYWSFERLGVLDKMKDSDFVKKYSVQFVTNTGKESQPFYFDQHDPRECSQTWQVERADFDKMLFDNAGDKGADCVDATRVMDILFEGDQVAGVVLKTADGGRREVACKIVIDGSGQQSVIANKLGLKVELPGLRKAAIWTYFKDAYREDGPNGGATLILHTKSKDAWFWYIPLSDGITSVGLVGDNEYILKNRTSPGDTYCEELGNCPAVANRIKNATWTSIDSGEGQFHIAKEFSYTTTQHAGPGWALIGDAFGFLDPIYSSGVFFALKTGEMAADAAIEGLAKGDLSGEQLGKWSGEFKQGAKLVHQLVNAYYTNEFSFGSFMKQFPQHQGNLTDLLIGRVYYDGAGAIFDDMQPILDELRAG